MKVWQKILAAVLLVALGVWLAFRPRYVITISPYDGQQWLVESTSGRTWMFTGGQWTEVLR